MCTNQLQRGPSIKFFPCKISQCTRWLRFPHSVTAHKGVWSERHFYDSTIFQLLFEIFSKGVLPNGSFRFFFVFHTLSSCTPRVHSPGRISISPPAEDCSEAAVLRLVQKSGSVLQRRSQTHNRNAEVRDSMLACVAMFCVTLAWQVLKFDSLLPLWLKPFGST